MDPRDRDSSQSATPPPEPFAEGDNGGDDRAARRATHAAGQDSAASEESEGLRGDELPGQWDAPPPRPEATAAASAGRGDDHRWLEDWLNDRVDELERQLRRRTIALGSALALSGLTTVAALGFAAMILLHGPEWPPTVVLKAAPSPDGPTAPLVMVGKLAQAPEIGPSQADQALAVARLGGSGEFEERGKAAGKEPSAERAGVPGQADPERPELSPGAAQRGGTAITAPQQGVEAPTRTEAVQVEQQATGGGRYEAMIATELHAMLESTRAGAQAPRERLDASRRGTGRLNAPPAAAMAGRGTAEGPPEAGPQEGARAEADVVAPPAPAPASVETAASDSSAADRGNESQAGEAAYYAATQAVNLRAAPSNESEVLAVVRRGDVVRGIGREDDWLRVDHTPSGARNVKGWIYGSFLRRVEAAPEGSGLSARAGG